MSKITKIDTVRAELLRIASHKDRADIISPTMRACWAFPRVMIIGKLRMQPFDFDELNYMLAKIPTGAGEAFFWNFVSGKNVDSDRNSRIERNRVVVRLQDYRELKKV
jgi:hypothetical protein